LGIGLVVNVGVSIPDTSNVGEVMRRKAAFNKTRMEKTQETGKRLIQLTILHFRLINVVQDLKRGYREKQIKKLQH
jgi:hypothetical protein